jgi:hypothetical protein
MKLDYLIGVVLAKKNWYYVPGIKLRGKPTPKPASRQTLTKTIPIYLQ